ncbi:divergent PAP2 family protein [Candidatus Woesearchaeota archaeon]|nr:MAG: divergent PAP2 family protein [Candidatus Woesearchaeota archaeon]
MVAEQNIFSTGLFWAVFISFALAETIKFVTKSIKEGKISIHNIFGLGGMPSSHSASVTSVVTYIFLLQGFSTLFAVAFVFAVITINDAMGVRLVTGIQNRILKRIVPEKNRSKRTSRKLDSLVGHTPVEVFVGLAIGMLVSLVVYYFFFIF